MHKVCIDGRKPTALLIRAPRKLVTQHRNLTAESAPRDFLKPVQTGTVSPPRQNPDKAEQMWWTMDGSPLSEPWRSFKIVLAEEYVKN
jgi:hypothetical protein